MSRFTSATPLAPNRSSTGIGSHPIRTRTAEGGVGYIPSDAHAELFNAAVSGLLTDRFYESTNSSIARLVGLVARCDPEWLRGFIPWLRSEANVRTASVVLAAEYVRAGFPNGRQLVAATLQRADEPAELIGYWMSRYGRNIPKPIKRGIADAVERLYTQRSLLKYDGSKAPIRFGDVIEIVHPKPPHETSKALYKFALDRRRHDAVAHPGLLPQVSATLMLEALPTEGRSVALLRSNGATFNWERVAGWLPGGMTAEAWEALIPDMNYMALMRNLNNFDRAGISKMAATAVMARLTADEEVRQSKQFPFRFLTAYKNMESDTYKVALSEAADLAVQNLPAFPGRTLIMVDCSGSMRNPAGGGESRNPPRLTEVAGLFAEALARRCTESLIVCYSNSITSASGAQRHVQLLRAATHQRYTPTGGTYTWRCTEQAYVNGADRVIVLTDEQSADQDNGVVKCPVITWNLAGHQTHHAKHGPKNRFFVAGYNDTVLQTLPAMISHGSTGTWPWDAE